jgi:chitinase
MLAASFNYAQNIGINNAAPNANAILDIKSGNKGLLIPRMDSAVRKQISNTKGLLVYDTTTASLWHNDGAKWVNYLNMPRGYVAGDMLSWDGNNWSTMQKGTAGQFLGVDNNGLVGWQHPSTLAISDATVTEGDAGTVNLTFTVTKTLLYNKTVAVQYATSNGTAIAGTDYTATSGTLVFSPADVSKTITVVVTGDLNLETDEALTVILSNPVDATIIDASGTGTITNDDYGLTLQSNQAVAEGNSGSKTMTYTVALSAACPQTITVNYTTSDVTATAGQDYSINAGTLSFAPGETIKTITVQVSGDVLYEASETYTVNLSGNVNAQITNGQVTGTITNDDSAPTLSIQDVSITEGNTGTKNLAFTVSISAPSAFTTTVSYATQNNAAVSPTDYIGTTGTVTFPPLTTTAQTINIVIIGDVNIESNEDFLVNLSNAINAVIASPKYWGRGTIINDD